MTKNDLIKALVSNYNELTEPEIENMVKHVFDLMAQQLEQGLRIEIRGFGSFSTKERSSREARNPKTQEIIYIKPRKAVQFKPGKDLRSRVNIIKC